MSEVTKELLELVWGTKSSPGLSDTIFCRWTQGTRAGLTVPAAQLGLWESGQDASLGPSTPAPPLLPGPITPGTWRLAPMPYSSPAPVLGSSNHALGTAFCPSIPVWAWHFSASSDALTFPCARA